MLETGLGVLPGPEVCRTQQRPAERVPRVNKVLIDVPERSILTPGACKLRVNFLLLPKGPSLLPVNDHR